MDIKKSTTLHFEKTPKMIFVSEDGKTADLYIDGKKINGMRNIIIRAGVGEPVMHEIDFVTFASGEK